MNAPGYASPMHEAVGAELRLDDDRAIRRHWEPGEHLLMLFGRAQLLAIAGPLVVEKKWTKFVKLKPIELAIRLGFIFTQGTRYDADAAARTWVTRFCSSSRSRKPRPTMRPRPGRPQND